MLLELAATPKLEPLNRTEELYPKFSAILGERGIAPESILQNSSPYWAPGSTYDPMEVAGTSVQFMDKHKAPLPRTTLPPARDVETFIDGVLKEPGGPVSVDRQFEMLLDITDNNVTGAANLGMMATRYIGRAYDRRAYPELTIDDKTYTPDTDFKQLSELMRSWNDKIAKFEYDEGGKNDGSGDLYYFWTHFYAGLAFASTDTRQARALSKVFENGTEVMQAIKGKVTRNGVVITNRFEVSHLGRDIGLALAGVQPYDLYSNNKYPIPGKQEVLELPDTDTPRFTE